MLKPGPPLARQVTQQGEDTWLEHAGSGVEEEGSEISRMAQWIQAVATQPQDLRLLLKNLRGRRSELTDLHT